MTQFITTKLQECELKFKKGKAGTFSGYASVFGGVDSYNDTIIPGAYKSTIESGRRIPMFINHDSFKIPVGSYPEMKEDDHGLLVTGRINMQHADGPSLHSALDKGDMDGLSIGFSIPKGGAVITEEGIRELHVINLKEISAVNFPADDDARILSVKQDIDTLSTIKDFEYYMRESCGFSKSAATAFVSRFKRLIQCETDDERKKVEGVNVTEHLCDVIRQHLK